MLTQRKMDDEKGKLVPNQLLAKESVMRYNLLARLSERRLIMEEQISIKSVTCEESTIEIRLTNYVHVVDRLIMKNGKLVPYQMHEIKRVI